MGDIPDQFLKNLRKTLNLINSNFYL